MPPKNRNSFDDTQLNIVGNRWMLGRVIWRWWTVLLAGPSIGLIIGLLLVFLFLRKNLTVDRQIIIGHVPEMVDHEAYISELIAEFENEHTWSEVSRNLNKDRYIFKVPEWWVRSRINVKRPTLSHGFLQIDISYTFLTYEGYGQLSEAFQESSKEIVSRVYSKHSRGWEKKIDNRLTEIDELFKEMKPGSQTLATLSSLKAEQRQLSSDLQFISGNELSLGCEYGFLGWYKGYAPWWKAPPQWIVFVCYCMAYGMLASFPVVACLELIRPISRVRGVCN